MSTLFLLLGIAFVLALFPLAFLFARGYRRSRGPRVVVCPETKTAVAVEVDAARAAWSGVTGDPEYRLESCSRWPERQGCGQDCLAQIESAPDGCLVRTRLTEWYEDSTCAVCGRMIGEIHWYDRKPALISLGRKPLALSEVAAEKLPEVLATHRPLCFDCHVAETFRARFPERVVEDPRPAQRLSRRSSGSSA